MFSHVSSGQPAFDEQIRVGESMLQRRSILAALGTSAAALAVAQTSASASQVVRRQAQEASHRHYLPLPGHARSPEFSEKGYLLDDLGGGLFGVRNSEGSNSMFLITRTGVVVVDAPMGGVAVRSAIAEVTKLPVTHFVYSHPHADHTGGAALFAEGKGHGQRPVYIAHKRAAERIRRANDPRRPNPDVEFEGDRFVLRSGGQKLILDYHGDLHSAGDLFIFAPKQKTLMLVDVIAPRYAPYFHLGHTNDVPLYLGVARTVLKYEFDTFVGGHAYHYGTRSDIELFDRYLSDLEKTARQVFVEDANNVDYTGVELGNAWAGSDVFYETLASKAAERMPKHWESALAGADVFLQGNMRSMMYSLWTDFPM